MNKLSWSAIAFLTALTAGASPALATGGGGGSGGGLSYLAEGYTLLVPSGGSCNNAYVPQPNVYVEGEVYYYDSNKEFIEGDCMGSATSDSTGFYIFSLEAPPNADYVQFVFGAGCGTFSPPPLRADTGILAEADDSLHPLYSITWIKKECFITTF